MAQRGRGIIRGLVTDASGAAVPGATVTVSNTGTQIAINTVTNETGNYFVPNLVIGQYTVSVTKQGFKKFERSGINLAVDEEIAIDVSLQTGQLSESVVVSAEAPLVDPSSGAVGSVVDTRSIVDLPTDGRNVFDLVEITPGVQNALTPVASSIYARTTAILGVSMNGGVLANNNMVIDGTLATDAYIPNGNVNPSVDGIQEFKVQTGPVSAEYGYTLGGFVSAATRSGTNQPHGSAYEFLRNDAFDANSWANNRTGAAKVPLRFNQYGGTFGGPVWIPKVYDGRNRTFFFFNYEGYHFGLPTAGPYSLPTQAMQNGDFSQLRDANCNLVTLYDPASVSANPNKAGFYIATPFPGNVIPSGRFDPVSRNIEKYYPLPNVAPSNACANTNNYFGAETQHSTQTQVTNRVDHRVSQNNALFIRHTYYKEWRDNGASNLYPDPIVRDRYDPRTNNNASLSDVHTFSPSFLNELRVGLTRGVFDFSVASAFGGWPQKLWLPANVPPDSFPAINNGLPTFSTGTIGIRGSRILQLFDAVTVVRRGHSFKGGLDFLLAQGNNFQEGSPSGSFNFPANLTGNPDPSYVGPNGNQFATFLLGAVGSATATTTLGESEQGNSYSFFVQDDWRLNRRLTLNLGVRYSLDQPPYERNNGSSRFSLSPNPLTGLPGATQYMGIDFKRVFNTNHNDWAPRVAFAYDLLGNQKTVLRGGYAIFYAYSFSEWNGSYGDINGFGSTTSSYPTTNSVFPAFQFSSGLPHPPTPSQGPQLGPNLAFSSGDYRVYESYSPTPRSQQWDFGIQQQVGKDYVLSATYSANRGTHLIASPYNLNQLNPQYYSLGNQLLAQVANPYAGKVPGPTGAATVTMMQTLLPYPWLGNVAVTNPHLAESTYHALLLSAQKRFSKGLVLLSSFTFSKLISEGIANTAVTSSYSLPQFAGLGYQNGLYNRAAESGVDPNKIPTAFPGDGSPACRMICRSEKVRIDCSTQLSVAGSSTASGPSAPGSPFLSAAPTTRLPTGRTSSKIPRCPPAMPIRIQNSACPGSILPLL
jgi:hypothetical protein